jgi:hypothetical protein
MIGSGLVISVMSEVMRALIGRDGREDMSDGLVEGGEGSGPGFTQMVSDFGKKLFDGVEVRRVRGRKKSLAPALRTADDL